MYVMKWYISVLLNVFAGYTNNTTNTNDYYIVHPHQRNFVNVHNNSAMFEELHPQNLVSQFPPPLYSELQEITVVKGKT